MTVPITLVNDVEPRAQYTAVGNQTAFSVDFPIRSTDELTVLFGDGATPDIGYAVNQPNDDAGFTVTFTNPPPVDTRITILRDGEIAFQANLGQERAFNAAAFNAAMGDIYLRLLELRTRLQRTLRLPDSDPVLNLILPPVIDRANRFAYFNAAGELTALASLGGTVDAPLLDFAAYPFTFPNLTDTVLLNVPGEPPETLVRRTTIEEILALAVTAAQPLPFRTVQTVGLAGDGATDDSYLLQADMDAMATLAGGAVYFLTSPIPGGSFFFRSTPRVPSNTSLFFFSPILFAKDAGLRTEGEYAAVADRDNFRLATDVAAGVSSIPIDAGNHGGGAVTGYWAAGDVGEITGLRDGCGTALQSQIFRVTAVSSTAITISGTTIYAYAASFPSSDFESNYGISNQTVIRKLVAAVATADLLIGENLVSIRAGDVGNLIEGDLVLVEDERTSDQLTGTAGSSPAPINWEVRPIAASVPGDPSASVRLAGRVEHDFTSAKFLTLIKINPARDSLVSGARALFSEAPDITPLRHVFMQRLARGSRVTACTVPNTDQYGRRGNAFRADVCYECGFEDVKAFNAKYYAAGEGYGVAFDRSTNCWIRGGTFNGMRHSVLYQGATNCHDFDVQISNSRSTAWDCHGQGEAGCVYHNITIDGSTNAESSPGRASYAISIGNTTWLGGTRGCGGESGRIVGFSSDTGATLPVVRLVPGFRDCFIKGTTFKACGQILAGEDVIGFGTCTGSGFEFSDNTIDGVELPKSFDLHGRRNGASVDTLLDVRIANNVWRNLHGGGSVQNITEFEFAANKMDEVTVDASFSWCLELTSVTGAEIVRNDFKDFSRGIKLVTSTNMRIDFNRFADLVNVTLLNDGGGNTGYWRDNLYEGTALPLYQSSNSPIIFSPRIAAPVDVLDDTVLKITPAATRGRAFFTSLSGTSFVAHFTYYTVTPAIDAGGDSSPIVDFTTGALTGTSGTDGKITVSVHTDGTLQVENRTGATLKVDGKLI